MACTARLAPPDSPPAPQLATPLCDAARLGRLEVVRELLGHGAAVDAVDVSVRMGSRGRGCLGELGWVNIRLGRVCLVLCVARARDDDCALFTLWGAQ